MKDFRKDWEKKGHAPKPKTIVRNITAPFFVKVYALSCKLTVQLYLSFVIEVIHVLVECVKVCC